MYPNDGFNLRGIFVATTKEFIRDFDQHLHCFKEFALRYFATEMTPEYLNRVQSGAIDW